MTDYPGKASRRDVAELAGVSVTTVTHSLNATEGTRVKKATMEKVREAAAQLDYRPSFVGRALVTGKSYTVGLLQPSYEAIFSKYYQCMIVGMVQAMEKCDYNMVILFQSDDFHYMKPVNQGRVDGMLILQSLFGDTHINHVIESGIPTVVLNKDIEIKNKNVGNVHSDHFKLMDDVVDEFLSLGCKRIISFHDYRTYDPNYWIFEGFVKATSRYINDGVVGTSIIPDETNIEQQIKNIFDSHQAPIGIFIDGVELADIFLRIAEQVGFRHGKHFSLITSSCIPGDSTKSKREISVYSHQPEKIGVNAWNLLWQMLSNKKVERKKLIPYLRKTFTI